MKTDYSETYYRAKIVALPPTVDNIRLMCGAARQAFNRSSLAELEEINRLQDIITLDLDEFFEEVELAQAEKANADNPYLKKLYGVLGHLEHIADEMKKMAEPIQRKIKEASPDRGSGLFSRQRSVYPCQGSPPGPGRPFSQRKSAAETLSAGRG